MAFVVLGLYTFIDPFMGSMWIVYQQKHHKSSQISHTGPLSDLCWRGLVLMTENEPDVCPRSQILRWYSKFIQRFQYFENVPRPHGHKMGKHFHYFIYQKNPRTWKQDVLWESRTFGHPRLFILQISRHYQHLVCWGGGWGGQLVDCWCWVYRPKLDQQKKEEKCICCVC